MTHDEFRRLGHAIVDVIERYRTAACLPSR